MKSAARRLSSPVRRSRMPSPFSSGITRIEVSPKTSFPSIGIFSFLSAASIESHIVGSPENTSRQSLSFPDFVTITTISSGTIGLYVRGGDGSDNLFLIDGVPMYQVTHLIGLFSSFNTDVVQNVDFYKGGFPARYGGRLSSVVDVSVNEGG